MARNYENYSKDDLINHIHELEKQLKTNKYGLYWDKSIEQESVISDCKANIPVLQRQEDLCMLSDEDADTHILIEGDNFHALTALNMMCGNGGFVDVIYIDPPYNRGKDDFRYNDKYVNEDDGYRHSKWISFMHDRLQLARKLLKNTGVMFISIDDNEQSQLKMLCDEIFGEENFITCMPRRTKSSGKTTNKISSNHDYLLVYEKIKNESLIIELPHIDEGFNKEDEYVAERGKYKLNQTLDYDSLSYSQSLDYPIELEGHTLYPGGSYEKYMERQNGNYQRADWAWRWSKDKFEFGLRNGFIELKQGRDRPRIYTKTYLNAKIETNDEGEYIIVEEERTKPLSSIDLLESKYSNDNAKKDLKKIFGTSNFDYPKPVELVKTIISIYGDKNAVIMDFFAGSGTAAQAVLEMNKEDEGHRKIVLCTNNEDNICYDVTYPRIKTVITGKRQDGTEYSKGISANLMYYKTDFIKDSKNTDQAKYCLVEKVDELLCIIEETYVGRERTDYYSHYETLAGDKHTFIYSDYYSAEPFSEFIELINSVDGEKIVYMFSTDNIIDEKLFGNVDVKPKPIPNKIYEIYKEIVEDIKRGEQ